MSEEKHPDPVAWWWHRRVQSYIGVVGLIGVGLAAFNMALTAGEARVLETVGLGCILLVVGYGPGSTLVDIVKAWRGN